MCNSWILLFLLFCNGGNCLGNSCNHSCSNNSCGNNSGCGCSNSCGTTRQNANDCGGPTFPTPCDNDFIQPRSFFTGPNTCGCETSQSSE